tara:strand:+ start:339 stop:584 length:246 start_codon:yes stop_codon:yes gene_type:complete
MSLKQWLKDNDIDAAIVESTEGTALAKTNVQFHYERGSSRFWHEYIVLSRLPNGEWYVALEKCKYDIAIEVYRVLKTKERL